MAQTDATRVEHIHAWGFCRSDFECVLMTCGTTRCLNVQAAQRCGRYSDPTSINVVPIVPAGCVGETLPVGNASLKRLRQRYA